MDHEKSNRIRPNVRERLEQMLEGQPGQYSPGCSCLQRQAMGQSRRADRTSSEPTHGLRYQRPLLQA